MACIHHCAGVAVCECLTFSSEVFTLYLGHPSHLPKDTQDSGPTHFNITGIRLAAANMFRI